WCRRHRQRLGWCAAAFLVVATALFGWLKLREVQRQHDQERREAELELRQKEEARQAAQREAAQLHTKNQARTQVAQFRRLADEMRVYAAVPDPAGDQAPPFYDLENGERKGREALALVTDWGPALADLPLVEEQGPVKSELYDLLLLMAQTRGRRAADAAARDMLALLDRAALLRMPSASYHRLRAQGHRL